jgi:hypothetical protein
MTPKSKTEVININQSRFVITTRDFGRISQIVVQQEGLSFSDLEAFYKWLGPRRDEMVKKPTLFLLPDNSILAWRNDGLVQFLIFDQRNAKLALN